MYSEGAWTAGHVDEDAECQVTSYRSRNLVVYGWWGEGERLVRGETSEERTSRRSWDVRWGNATRGNPFPIWLFSGVPLVGLSTSVTGSVVPVGPRWATPVYSSGLPGTMMRCRVTVGASVRRSRTGAP